MERKLISSGAARLLVSPMLWAQSTPGELRKSLIDDGMTEEQIDSMVEDYKNKVLPKEIRMMLQERQAAQSMHRMMQDVLKEFPSAVVRGDEIVIDEKDMLAQPMRWNFTKRYGRNTPMFGVRKLRTREMFNAMIQGNFSNGNRQITCHDNLFNFYYRGTCIASFDRSTGEYTEVHAGEFEESPSTRGQREAARQATEEFMEAEGTQL